MAPRSQRTEIMMAGFRVMLGLLFLTVWGSNLNKGLSEIGVPNEWIWSLVFPALAAFAVAWLPAAQAFSLDERLRDRPPFDRLPRWATG
jgi:hypothetical protein